MRYIYSLPQSEVSPGVELFSTIDKMHAGDVLAVPDVNHIALNWRDLEWILHLLAERTAVLEVQRTARKHGESTESGFKSDLRRAAIHRARTRGRYKACGRKRKVSPEAIGL